MESLSFYSLNCRGLNSTEKRTKLFTWFTDINADIILLQETHFIEKYENNYNARWFGKYVHNFSDSQHSRGTSILFRKQLDIKIINVHKSNDGRILLLNLIFEETNFSIMNIYAPNSPAERKSFFMKINNWVIKHSLEPDNIIIAGDFNCNLEKTDDPSVKNFQNILKNNNLIDLWASLRQDLGYTWLNGTNTPASRIDYFLVSKSFTFLAQNIILREVPGLHSGGTRMSDHKCIKVDFQIDLNLRGPGYWKFNTSLLDDNGYVTAMKGLLDNFESKENAHDAWEALKTKIKNYSVCYSKSVNKTYKCKIKQLENDICEIEKSNSEKINMNKKRKLESELKELINKKAKGAQIRSRAKWIDEGETNTAFLLK